VYFAAIGLQIISLSMPLELTTVARPFDLNMIDVRVRGRAAHGRACPAPLWVATAGPANESTASAIPN
jgi:hypothetical protein